MNLVLHSPVATFMFAFFVEVLLRRRRDLVVRQKRLHYNKAIRIAIENRIAPRQACASDHVCHHCWLRLKRSVMWDNYEQQAKPKPQEGPEPQPQEAVSSINSDHDEQAYEVPGVIDLPNYRRAANTASHCIFYGCQNVDLRKISDPLGSTTLSQHRYYLPKNARNCVKQTPLRPSSSSSLLSN